ncbi:MAG: hypothetical protein IT318_14365 [Anaerolineales bacterium]|nr:hypothetical protein [Anaerolineales bacterium]
MPDLGQVDWVTLGIVVVALVVGWTILKAVLKLTTRVFSLGCLGLLALAGVLAAMAYWGGG